MQRKSRWTILVLAVAGFAASACGGPAAVEEAAPNPASVELVAGTDIARITLSQEAIDRVGIETALVAAGTAGGSVVPAAAVIYDTHGATWVYTNLEARVYQRAPITVTTIKADQANLSAGPPLGTPVVIVGVAELFGTETGVGDPE